VGSNPTLSAIYSVTTRGFAICGEAPCLLLAEKEWIAAVNFVRLSFIANSRFSQHARADIKKRGQEPA